MDERGFQTCISASVMLNERYLTLMRDGGRVAPYGAPDPGTTTPATAGNYLRVMGFPCCGTAKAYTRRVLR